MKKRFFRPISMVALLLSVMLLGAACSNTDEPADEGTDDQTTEAAPINFGAGCEAVPADGAGSFNGMAQVPVATAASANPVLTTLVTAVTAAELGDTLNSAEGITVFAPANSAFEAMDQDTLNAALADPKGLLTKVLTYHVLPVRLSPEDLAGEHETLEGSTLEVEGSGEDFTVDGNSSVVCGNVQTANATVYIIDQVLMP